jgi:thiol:disulfide interchange protein
MAGKIAWLASLDSAQAEAKKQGKHVLVDFTAAPH